MTVRLSAYALGDDAYMRIVSLFDDMTVRLSAYALGWYAARMTAYRVAFR